MPLKELGKNTSKTMSVAGKEDGDCNHDQQEQANTAPVEQTVRHTECLELQVALESESLTEITDSDHIISHTAEHNPTATPFPAPNARAAPKKPSSSPESPLIFPSGRPKPLNFSGLDVLPPARLCGDGRTPPSSWIPFTKDESVSQEHARCNFLRVNFGHATWMPARPGIAVRKLRSRRMLYSAFE
ncbi:hypothetical protein N0V91_002078 [Didymella pomorum]|uniref:Uncharacterized protein n=1 Tax=Didymella pomorum TaxID=749634 RepID=A0A9W9DAC8_9PLEO|nr:hypothetical protein N0V91_002078 [Didymella pomorum]